MTVLVKIDPKKVAVSTGILNKLIEKELGDVWEYKIAKSSGIRKVMSIHRHGRKRVKVYFKGQLWKGRNIVVGYGLALKLNNAVIIEKPNQYDKLKILVRDEEVVKILQKAGFNISDDGILVFDVSEIFDVLEWEDRRYWGW